MLPDEDRNDLTFLGAYASQCTYRCVVLPDLQSRILDRIPPVSQCTYRCVVLPDIGNVTFTDLATSLNAPTGAWCSLTSHSSRLSITGGKSQCTYRCVVLPDHEHRSRHHRLCHVSMHLQVRGAP